MAHEKLRPQYFFDAGRIEQLKQLAPECFEDGQINFETLRQNLGDWAQDDTDPELEHFGLFWPGKRDARKAAAIPPEGALQPVWGEGLKADGTPDTDGHNDSKNIFIEGENLEVLKLLQKSYANKVKMIYIDPPYNTGNDFVYDDDFTEPLNEYLRRTGQVDEEGKPMTTNKRSDGRFHSKWLSMMYPRLRLARNLLREDGVIFVSIDDNEVHNLRAIMNEIFGEENFLGTFIVNSTPNARDYGHIGKMHEYCLFYSKSFEQANTFELEEKGKEFRYKDKNGGFNIHPLYNSNEAFTPKNRKNLYYPFYVNPEVSVDSEFHDISLNAVPGWIEVFPPQSEKNNIQFVWRWGTTKAEENLNKEIVGYKTSSGDYRIVQKMRHTTKLIRSLLVDTSFSSRRGTAELEGLFNDKVFSFPKPLELVRTFIRVATEESDLILDFFAGSGTTAEAILNVNSEDRSSRRFICIQLPELINSSEGNRFRKVSEITKARLQIAMKNELNENRAPSGFQCLNLLHSSFKPWHNITTSTAELENQLDLFNQNPLREGWSKDGLLTEVMLMEGFTLCSSISTMDTITSNAVQRVTSEYCSHALLVCFDESIQPETIAALQLGEDDIFICLDSAISTQDKLRLSDKGLIKTI